MKVLIVNASDNIGGAAKAARRLHNALIGSGINSQMLVLTKVTDDYTVLSDESKIKYAFSKLLPTFDLLPVKLYKKRSGTLFSAAWFPFTGVSERINALKPDIVHLHWVCGGMIRIEDIANIKVPIVWSLHDNWAFTGGCHVMWDCDRYKEKCGRCPRLGSDFGMDLSRILFFKKDKTYSKISNLTLVGLSRWIASCATESKLLASKRIVHLPNLIDSTTFSPIDKTSARELLNLPLNKKLVVFGAVKAVSDINKGYKELCSALHLLENRNIEVVVFGSGLPKDAPKFGFNTHYVGYLSDDLSLRVLYNAADVVVVPSLQENLSNTIMESLACGTPVVAFDIGGNGDMIEHQINGYLARPFESKDLAQGIEWVLNATNYSELALNARAKILREFDSNVVVTKYIALYQNILNTHGHDKQIVAI
ncbi:glycosyltransferase family 4 protein [Methylomonas montana]|uniref:glycosyltransferase family 4 protein n=1 Tax=Methylomonas montana TaxID=3058963 RepID=UPI002659DFE5|nr:glycosyltransferase family 4 protein [Methylomonas montana]WKJ88627.1 glycosyltransferase family 4 protein [Methylomonas montana]